MSAIDFSVPQSLLFWLCIAVSVLLVVTGAAMDTELWSTLFGSLGSGVWAGVFGLWGVSLFVASILAILGYRVWYASGL